MYWNGCGWAWMAFMPLLWIVLTGLAVWAVVRLTHHRSDDDGSRKAETARRETPGEILDRRFASGEIDANAYDEARRRLSAHPARPG